MSNIMIQIIPKGSDYLGLPKHSRFGAGHLYIARMCICPALVLQTRDAGRGPALINRRIWAVKTLIWIPIFAVIGSTTTAVASEAERRNTYQKVVELCLKKHNIGAQCYVTGTMSIHCSGNIDSNKSIRRICNDEGNAANRPERRVMK